MASTTVPIIDLSAFTTHNDADLREKVARELAAKLSINGSIGIAGHGISTSRLQEAFSISRNFFDLPYEDKMKAPHPDAIIPHRGYSGVGRENGSASLGIKADGVDKGTAITQVKDHKESFELGSEENKVHYNIWPPEELVPGFRQFNTEFYWELNRLSFQILDALALSLGLSESETQALKALHTGHDNQVRLLHYPPASRTVLNGVDTTRIGAHRDWSTFTLLFQDKTGGLEFYDKESQTYIPAEPKEGVVYMNIGDMFQRFSNGIYPSAMHRVVASRPHGDSIPPRYSIPYFVSPEPSKTIAPPQTLVTSCGSAIFEPVTFAAYAAAMDEAIRA